MTDCTTIIEKQETPSNVVVSSPVAVTIISSVPQPPPVLSVHGRIGHVIAAADDYALAQITGLVDGGAGSQFLADDGTYKAPTEANIVDLDRLRWRGVWTAQQYLKNDVVSDTTWGMVCINDTFDRAAPQAVGAPAWVSGEGDSPAWGAEQDTVDTVITGQRYTWGVGGVVSRMRFWVPVNNPLVTYELVSIGDPTGSPVVSVLFPEAVISTTGWLEFNIAPQLVSPGTVFDIALITRSHAGETTWSGNWDYLRQNGNPGPGEIAHQNAGGGNDMRISHIDDDAGDRRAELEAMTLGDLIDFGGIEWTITGVVRLASHVQFTVSPAARTTAGMYSVLFTTFVPSLIDTVSIANHFLGAAAIQGYKSTTGIGNIVLDEDMYGIDMEIEEVTVSPDWQILAYAS